MSFSGKTKVTRDRQRKKLFASRKFKAAVKAQQPNQKGFVRWKAFPSVKNPRKLNLYHVENERDGDEVVQKHISYVGVADPELRRRLKVKIPKKVLEKWTR